MAISKNSIRRKLLEDRGLAITKPIKHQTVLYPTTKNNHEHTRFMRYLEMKYGKGHTIEEILISGSLNEVCKALGNEVDRSTVSKWIKQLKLRYNETNLPICQDCNYHQPVCDAGICMVLVDRRQWELVELKKKEVLG